MDVTQPKSASGNLEYLAQLLASWRSGLGLLLQALASQWALMMILTAGAVLRLAHLNSRGLNSDEAVYAGQAAAIAGDPTLSQFFPIFRAHPLLFQFTMALIHPLVGYDGIDIAGRMLAVIIGLLTIIVVYKLGTLLYGRQVGLVGGLFIAVMPYHVIVTRQVLLDGPMVFFATLSLYLLARFASTRQPAWLYAASASLGLMVLAKETGIILVASIFIFLALSPEIRIRFRSLLLAMACLAIVMLPFPLSLQLSGGGSSEKGGQYLAWQLFRRPNHDWTFYPTSVPPLLGILVVIAALAGLWLLRHERTWRERLLVAWIVVPVVFFQLWPVKGLQYLLPIAPPMAILAARTLVLWSPAIATKLHPRSILGPPVRVIAIVIVVLSLIMTSWQHIQPFESDVLLAGSGGMPGGRDAGLWIRNNTPEGSQFITIGPSMANVVQFYGHRRAFGLSVSTNPLHRNPSYEPIRNPDLQLRNAELHYIVWDSFSASRSTFFSESLERYIKRYNGRVIHTEYASVRTESGETTTRPIIIIYEVHP